MILNELKDAGIDPYSDVKKLSFGGTHDVVFYAVLNGDVDVGIVRTNILEQMDAEDKIDIDDLTVINPQHVSGFPFVLSSRLYPEWAFAKVIHTPQGLAKDVAIALFKIEENNPAAIACNNAGWTIPLDYWPVHECLKELRVGPYVGYGEISLYDDDKPNVFIRFKRVGKSSVKGIGLGLAIVKRIVELHGRDVGV